MDVVEYGTSKLFISWPCLLQGALLLTQPLCQYYFISIVFKEGKRREEYGMNVEIPNMRRSPTKTSTVSACCASADAQVDFRGRANAFETPDGGCHQVFDHVVQEHINLPNIERLGVAAQITCMATVSNQ
jgi:hypothetical protein